MAGGIYLVQASGSLVEMSEQRYDAESRLQQLLADYPNLLAGDQLNPSAPRRWLLVRKEAGIPSEEGGGNRWALDHLFLDQDAIPTLIEVKRSTDTRIRREVVGQMLDYAANAVVYWPAESIRFEFEATCRKRGQDPDEVLDRFLGGEAEPDAFWQAAIQNLQAGKIRMVFVADVIPPELQRIVEFLNEQMKLAQVVAVEIRQFVGEGQTALVPKVIGQTAAAQQAKAGTAVVTSGRQWDEASFFEDLTTRRGVTEAAVARDILRWAQAAGLRIWWGKGKSTGSFFPMLDHAGSVDWTIGVYTEGSVEIQFQRFVSRSKQVEGHPFESDADRLALLEKLNALPGVRLDPRRIALRPNLDLGLLVDPTTRDQFLDILTWVVTQLRAWPAA